MQLNTETLPGYLTRAQVKEGTGLTDAQIEEQRPNGYFPDPELFPHRPELWIDFEISDWIVDNLDVVPGCGR